VTDRYGSFAFKPVVQGRYELTFTHTRYVTRDFSLSAVKDTQLSVAMLPAGARSSVAGSVWEACNPFLDIVCNPRPIAGCTVTVSSQWMGPIPYGPAADAAVMPVRIFIGVTNKDGAYRIDSIPISVNGERVVVTARKGGFIAQAVDTSLVNLSATTVDFALERGSSAFHDTVYVSPSNPTVKDSLRFSLFNASLCCCAVYSDQSVQVTGKEIYLSYTVDESPCQVCMCLMAGSYASFSAGPVAAGKYKIYKVENTCLGPICPAIAIMPVLVGTVTVTAPTQAVSAAPQRQIEPEVVTSGSAVSIGCRIDRNVPVELTVYNGLGAPVARLKSGSEGPGMVRVNWDGTSGTGKRVAPGQYLLQLSLDGKAVVTRHVLIAR
jgi:hypothetical protein